MMGGDLALANRLDAGERGACVGPNAIIQTSQALKDLIGSERRRALFAAAGLAAYVDAPPGAMVDEAEPARLFREIVGHCDPGEAEALLAEAGFRTGGYIIANRIPGPAKTMLSWMPRVVALRVLLSAIQRHAWTFAGSGKVEIAAGLRPALTITGNPLATPGCPWHCAVFERLFAELVSPAIVVRHADCEARGGQFCRFEFGWP